MPVILDPVDFETWLDPDSAEPAQLARLLAPCPADWLELYAVSQRVNDPSCDTPECVEPVVEPQGSLF
jgi:putative SOS response-associated peptidase YedK